MGAERERGEPEHEKEAEVEGGDDEGVEQVSELNEADAQVVGSGRGAVTPRESSRIRGSSMAKVGLFWG